MMNSISEGGQADSIMETGSQNSSNLHSVSHISRKDLKGIANESSALDSSVAKDSLSAS